MDDVYARLNSNPTKIAAWAQLLMLGSPTPSDNRHSPDVLYTRALPIFKNYKRELVQSGWSDIPMDKLANGILFMVERTCRRAPPHHPSSESLSNGSSSPYFSDSKTSSTSSPEESLNEQPVIFALPSELSTFLEYRHEFQKVFQNPLLFSPGLDAHGHPVLLTASELEPALRDIFYLLQLIIPGMLLLVHDSLSFARKSFTFAAAPPPTGARRRDQQQQRSEASQSGPDSAASRGSTKVSLRRTRRALPPAEWIEQRLDTLEGVFGRSLLHSLLVCARDVELTVWTTFHGPDGDRLETGSDAGFAPSVDIDWYEDITPEEMSAMDIPAKTLAMTPGNDHYDRLFPHIRLARSL